MQQTYAPAFVWDGNLGCQSCLSFEGSFWKKIDQKMVDMVIFMQTRYLLLICILWNFKNVLSRCTLTNFFVSFAELFKKTTERYFLRQLRYIKFLHFHVKIVDISKSRPKISITRFWYIVLLLFDSYMLICMIWKQVWFEDWLTFWYTITLVCQQIVFAYQVKSTWINIFLTEKHDYQYKVSHYCR